MKKHIFLLLFAILTISNVCYAEWVIRHPMPHARYGAFVATINNKIYVIGGLVNQNTSVSFTEEYNPVLDTWISRPSMPTPRGLGVVGVINNKIYCIGGVRGRNLPVDTVEVYDPQLNQWQRKRKVPFRHFGYNGGVLGDSIYLCGGYFQNTSSYTDTVIVYCVSRDSWFVRQSMNTARVDFGCTAFSDNLYAIGGQFYQNFLNTNEKYIPGQNLWQTQDTLRLGRAGLACSVLDNSIFTIGGEKHEVGRKIYARVDIYYPILNQWIAGESINIARSYAGAVTVNNNIFIVGGITRSFNPTASLEQYLPSGIEEENKIPITAIPMLSISPNPYKYSTILRLNNSFNDNRVIKIYNNSGKLVKTFIVNNLNKNIVWDRTDNARKSLPAGIYFANLVGGDNQVRGFIKIGILK